MPVRSWYGSLYNLIKEVIWATSKEKPRTPAQGVVHSEGDERPSRDWEYHMKQTQTAQTKARTILAQQHEEELRQLYLAEKETAPLPTDTRQSDINSRARGRAITALVKKYAIEYQTIYTACIQQGYPSRNPPRPKGDS